MKNCMKKKEELTTILIGKKYFTKNKRDKANDNFYSNISSLIFRKRNTKYLHQLK